MFLHGDRAAIHCHHLLTILVMAQLLLIQLNRLLHQQPLLHQLQLPLQLRLLLLQ